MFKTDLQIAQECNMEHILKVAEKAGIPEEYVDCYGKYKGKISSKYYDKIKDNPDAKLILVTAVNPTPAGEGKTTVTIGLTEALQQMGKNAITCLREPSLGPCMGVKGGAAGGGYAQVVPMEDINLHFTGDLHAITTANNLLASMVDNHIQQGNELNIDPRRIAWKRCVDLNDRQLRNVISGLGGKVNGVPREDAFQITVASEIMAIFCLANDLKQLKEMLGRIIVGYTYEDEPVTAKMIGADGAMTVLLKDALQPNVVQTLENTLAIIHGGPFANIAHGCNSVMATKTANVTARIQPDIKESAEAILEKLGIPVSVFIDMTYRQVIANNGIPFALNLSKTIETRDELSDAQFNSMMEKGLLQAKANESKPAKEVFANLRKRI